MYCTCEHKQKECHMTRKQLIELLDRKAVREDDEIAFGLVDDAFDDHFVHFDGKWIDRRDGATQTMFVLMFDDTQC